MSYLAGLEKLEFAASQVAVMQQELKDLQPKLIATSEETDKLMIVIEQDTVEVEATKEVRQGRSEREFRSAQLLLSHIRSSGQAQFLTIFTCIISTGFFATNKMNKIGKKYSC